MNGDKSITAGFNRKWGLHSLRGLRTYRVGRGVRSMRVGKINAEKI